MPRPRKDQEGPSAVERMEAAFWDTLAEKPYSQITVSEIAKRAHVNKNAFYYHFSGLFDLASQSISNTLPRDLARILLMSEEGPEDATKGFIEEIRRNPELEEDANKVLLLVGKNGSHELVNVLKDLIMNAWLDLFDLSNEELSFETRTIIKFTLGGLIEVLSDEEILKPYETPIQAALQGGIADFAAQNVVQVLELAASDRNRATLVN